MQMVRHTAPEIVMPTNLNWYCQCLHDTCAPIHAKYNKFIELESFQRNNIEKGEYAITPFGVGALTTLGPIFWWIPDWFIADAFIVPIAEVYKLKL